MGMPIAVLAEAVVNRELRFETDSSLPPREHP
jgi:hypothetical protein